MVGYDNGHDGPTRYDEREPVTRYLTESGQMSSAHIISPKHDNRSRGRSLVRAVGTKGFGAK